MLSVTSDVLITQSCNNKWSHWCSNGLSPLLVPKFVLKTYWFMTCLSSFVFAQLSDGIRVWDIGAGQQHTLLLADGDCIQPILYYSGQQVKEVTEQTEEEEQTGEYTQQPVLLPFCMNVRKTLSLSSSLRIIYNKVYCKKLNSVHWCCVITGVYITWLFIVCACVVVGLCEQCVRRRTDVCGADGSECNGFYCKSAWTGSRREEILLQTQQYQESSAPAIAQTGYDCVCVRFRLSLAYLLIMV